MRPGDGVKIPRLVKIRGIPHALGESLPALFGNAFGLRTIAGSRGAVSPEHRKRHHDIRRPARAPTVQAKLALGGVCFGKGQGLAHFSAPIVGKWIAADAENHLTDIANVVSRRSLGHLGDRDLAGVGGVHLVSINPAAQAGGSEIPVVLRAGRDLGAFRKVKVGYLRPENRAGRGEDGEEC